MVKLSVGGGNLGHEEFSVVDVRMLRSKCFMMETGGGVGAMVEHLAWKERQDKACKARPQSQQTSTMDSLGGPMYSLTTCSTSSSNFRGCGDDCGPTCPRHARWEERWERKMKLKAGFTEDDKIDAITLVGDTVLTRGSVLGTLPTRGSVLSVPANKRSSVAKQRPKEKKKDEERPASENRGRSKREVERKDKGNVGKHWAAAKAAVQWILLFHRIRRQSRAADMVRGVVMQFGEWARVKKTISRLISSVKVLQRTFRVFQTIKRARCAKVEKEWQRVEDYHLQAYFRLYAQKIDEEQKKESERGGAMRVASKRFSKTSPHRKAGGNTDLESELMSIDWRAYRIPAKDRRFSIGRHYMATLRRQVVSERNFLVAVRSAFGAEQELMQFLRSFGADEVNVHLKDMPNLGVGFSPVPRPTDFNVSEDVILQLVAETAQNLVKVEPFQNHPANMDGLDTGEVGGGGSSPTRRARNKAEKERPVALGKLHRKAGDVRKWAAKAAQGEEEKKKKEHEEAAQQASTKKMDVAQVLERFTPRLRELSEAAARSSGSTGGRGFTEGLVLGLANASQLPSAESRSTEA